MRNLSERLANTLAARAGSEAVADLGGFLRCESCRRVEPLSPEDGGTYTAKGWPKCCGYTMRWWTARQVAAGEHTP